MTSVTPSSGRDIPSSVVKYYGRDIVMDHTHPTIDNSIHALKQVIEDILKMKSANSQWVQLKDALLRMISYLSDTNVSKKLYRVQILNEAVIPYLSTMKTNSFLDTARFQQIEYLLDILSDSDKIYSMSSDITTLHPAITCQLIDKLVIEINSKNYWRQSTLASKLQTAVMKQWTPILHDLRNALQNIGLRLTALGLVEVVGRPVVMMYPLWLLLREVLHLVKQIEHKQSISPTTVVTMVKAFLMLYVSSSLVSLLSMYQGMGYTCLALGGLTLMVSQSESHLKQFAPILSPHLTHIDDFLDKLTSIESIALRSFGMAQSSDISDHPRVEMLSESRGLRSDHLDVSTDPDISTDNKSSEQTEETFVSAGLRRRTVVSSAEKSPTWKTSKSK